MGNIKGENKGNSEPLFFLATGHSVGQSKFTSASEVLVCSSACPMRLPLTLQAVLMLLLQPGPAGKRSLHGPERNLSQQSEEMSLGPHSRCREQKLYQASWFQILALTLLSSVILASYLTSMCPCYLIYKDNNTYFVGLP